ncbi:MAG: NlpC/P60 family protein, partial [Coriobacteriia bacterium]|nr:NlpC/P60 family protein [Coriobacteriia bacterium]
DDKTSKDDKASKGDKAASADDEAAADKAATEKASKGKHAKKELTEEEKAAEAAKKYQENAKSFAENARDRADLDATTAVKSSVYESSYVSSNQSYTRIKYTTNLSTEMFIASIGEQARQIGQDKSLYASVMIAQAVIESDSGNSGLARAPYNNLFGIKGAYEGKSVTMSTQEDNGKGNLYTIDSAFRAYDTQEESLKDYADLLRGDMGHYYNAWKENAATYKDAARALQGTYATSTIYADTICAVIEAYDLTRFDDPLDFTITGKNAKGEKLTMDDYAQLQANAVSYLGTPYVWGGTTPDGFDCSGFVQYLYKQTFGIELPRTTYTQQNMGKEVAFKDLQMGDLLFFVEGGSTEHVAMYLGDGFYIHAPQPGESIKITDMESFMPTFAKRIIQTEDADAADKAVETEKVDKADKAEKADKADKAEDAEVAAEAETAEDVEAIDETEEA